jgi:hypothetical protein
MAKVVVVPIRLQKLSITVDDQEIELDLASAGGGAEPDTSSDTGSDTHSDAKAEDADDGKGQQPSKQPWMPDPLIISPLVASNLGSLLAGPQGEDLLQSLHVSVARSGSSLADIAAALGEAKVPDGVPHHVVIHHAADAPFPLSDLVARLRALPDGVSVTVLIEPADARR